MRITRLRAVSGVLALTLGTLGIAGCGGAKDAKSGAASKLVYWSMWTEGEGQQKAIKAALDDFSAETGIQVDAQWVGREVGKQVIPRLTAGNPPDLVDGGTDLLTSYGSTNLQNLTDVYKSKIPGEDLTVGDSLIKPMLKEVSGTDGPRLAPYSLVGSSVWYNQKVTPELSEHPPKTWAEFIKVLDKLKAAGRTPVALDGDIADYDAYWVLWALMRTGGPGTIANAAKDSSGQGFETPAWKRGTEAIQQLIKGGYFPKGFNGTKFPTQQSAWADQTSKTNLILMGSWLPTEATTSLTSQGKDVSKLIQFRSFPFPAISDQDKGAGVVDAGPIGFAVPRKALHKEAADKFIAYFLAKKQLSRIATVAKSMPARTDVTPPPDLAGYAKEFANATAFFGTNDGLYNSMPKWVTDVWQPAVVAFFEGKTDAAGFRAELSKRTADYHKNN
ncbi:hypothetical protein GCM10010522_71970 [Kribbella solani]